MLSVIFYWSFYSYKPIVFNNAPFPVDKQTVKAGDTITYTVGYCKYMNITPIVTRYFADGIIYMLSSNPASIKSIGCGTTKVQIVIPPTLMPDTYYIGIEYAYKVNPIRNISVGAKTIPFKVIQ